MSTRGNFLRASAFGQADDADFRLRKHRGRHIGVVDAHRPAAELGIGERMPFADGDRRQIDPIGDVADGEDVRHRGARIFIDRNAAIVRDLDADRFQTETGDIRAAADGKHHLVGRNACCRRTVSRHRPPPIASTAGDRMTAHDRDAALFHFGAQMSAHVVVEAAQDILAAIDHRYLRAEPGKNSGEFNGNIAAALDQIRAAAMPEDGKPRSTKSHARCRECVARDRARRRSRSECARH